MKIRAKSTLVTALLLIVFVLLGIVVISFSNTIESKNVAYADTTDVATAAEFTTAIGNGGSIRLTSDFTYPQSSSVTFSKGMTIDLNGHTITVQMNDMYCYWNFAANMTITDSAGGGKIINPSPSYAFRIDNNGSLTLAGGTLECSGTHNSGVDVWQGPFTMTGGTLKSDDESIWRDGGAVTISGGTIIGDFYQSDGNINITGGSFSFDPSSLLAEGYSASFDGEYWVINAANSYDLWIGDVEVTETNLSGIGWDFAPETNKLTLNNFSYSGTGYTGDDDRASAIRYEGIDTLTIELVGGSVIKNTKESEWLLAGLCVISADVEIIGSGSLNVEVTGSATDASYGIFLYGGLLTITNANVTAKGGETAWASDGIYTYGGITINNATVTASGGNTNCSDPMDSTYSVGIYSDGPIIMNSGTMVATGHTSIHTAGNDSYSLGISGGDDITIAGGNVNLLGGNAEYMSAGIFTMNSVTVTGGNVIAAGNSASGNNGMAIGINALNYNQSGGVVNSVGGNSNFSSGLVALNTTLTNGKFYTYAGSGHVENYGIYGLSVNDGIVTIGENVQRFEAIGATNAVLASIDNSVAMYGWTNKQGTEGGTEIPRDVGKGATNYKKIVAPHLEPGPDPEPTPGPEPTPAPGPAPEPTPKNEINDKDSGVSVITPDGVGIPDTITLRVEIKTSITTQDGKVDESKIQEKLAKNEHVVKVYDVKLIQTIAGVETEIQPSDIKEGTTIKVQINLPKDVKAKGLRVLHVHSNGTIDVIDNVKVEGKVAIIEVSSLSEFVLINQKGHGFCIGWVAFILVILELLCACVYTIIRFGLFKNIIAKCKLDILYDKVDLLTMVGTCVASLMFVFTLIALCVHPCAISIVSFIFATIICGGFTYFFIKDKQIIEKIKQEANNK